MGIITYTNPLSLPWQTDIMGFLVLGMFATAVTYSVITWRRGRRIYGVLMITAGVYGFTLEILGSVLFNVYSRGTFQIMVHPSALPFASDAPALPLYVFLYYPTVLFVGYKVVEALNVTRLVQVAAVGGLFTIALDAPYVMQGHTGDLAWWTYNAESPLVQYVGAWPIIDLCWLATCHALFFAVIAWAHPQIDPLTVFSDARWSTRFAAGGFPPMAATVVLLGTAVILSPMGVVTLLGLPQWLVAVALLVGFSVVTASALPTTTTRRPLEWITVALVGVYLVSFAVMVGESTIAAESVTPSILVQLGGMGLAVAMVVYPAMTHRREPAAMALTTPRTTIDVPQLRRIGEPEVGEVEPRHDDAADQRRLVISGPRPLPVAWRDQSLG